jgi:acyl carrier protein
MEYPMTAEAKVVSLFEKAAWEVARKKYDSLNVEQKISELGIDSVAMLEVIGFIEEELEIHLPDEKIARVQTLADLSNVIQSVAPDALVSEARASA